jgi:hypothetical protein
MATLEHLALLKQGVNAWNDWRKNNPGIIPVLSESDLRGADLRNANLGESDLRGADLSESDLRNANLRGALYTSQTQFPQGFNPIEAGMILSNINQQQPPTISPPDPEPMPNFLLDQFVKNSLK